VSAGLPSVPGVNVVGQFQSESGIGEAARSVVAALDAVGVPVLPALPPEGSPSRQGVDFPVVSLAQARFPVTLSLLTAYETRPFVAAAPEHLRQGRLVGLWWWEVEDLPDFMAEAFQHVDAVWAGTEHVQRALQRAAGEVPVERIRYAVRRPTPSGRSRAELGLPTEGCLFLTMFGFYSSIARKNPQGAIDAFLRAFPTPEPAGPQLVIKTIDEDAHPVEVATLRALVEPHPHIHLRPGYLDRVGVDDLLAAADVIVSLHRAEGFGYAPAEAMAIGRVAMATGYSGNLDYMTVENSVLVPADVVPIGTGGGPYPPESRWAEPDLVTAAALMRALAADPSRRAELGRRAQADLAARFSREAAGQSLLAALDRLPTPAREPGWLARRAALRRAAQLREAR
jgi:glycosyltransferase involved in cell wall biosynthesis